MNPDIEVIVHAFNDASDYEFDQLLESLSWEELAVVVDMLRTIEHKLNTRIYEILQRGD